MQDKKVLDLLKSDDFITLQTLEIELKLSARAVRSILSALRIDSLHHGFEIKTIRNVGYQLIVHDEQVFSEYLQSFEVSFGSEQLRAPRVLYYILQQNGYISTQKIADILGVSRNTIVRDLDRLSKTLESRNLFLDSKGGQGVRIQGDEHELRKIFSQYVINSKGYRSVTQKYFDFKESVNMDTISHILNEDLRNHNLKMSKLSFDSIVDHIRVLIYRAQQGNFISDMKVGVQTIDDAYREIAEKIISTLELEFLINFPRLEVEYLASQLAGKSSVEKIPSKKRDKLEGEIVRILMIIDREYLTDFSHDSALIDALLIHMYPLLTRIAHKIELHNPLIEYVSSRYANVFLVSLKFVELWNEHEVADLSRDEVGYLTLHFASHLERKKNEAINSFHRVLLISELGRGNVLLTKDKLKPIFSEAILSIDNSRDSNRINLSGADLVLSTIQLDEHAIHAPVIYIKEMIDDLDIMEMKDLIFLRSHGRRRVSRDEFIEGLFDPSLFVITEGMDYLLEIEKLASKMVDMGFADSDYPGLVLKRESKFSTIYENGVAGPHSMELNAIEEKIGIIVPKNTMVHKGRKVDIIFLINMKQGDLFLYRLVSKLMQAFIEDTKLKNKLRLVSSYNDFLRMVKNRSTRVGD